MKLLFLCLGLWLVLQPTDIKAAGANHAKITQSIQTLLTQQRDAWNEGNIEKFMETYAKTKTLRFASDGKITHGWQATLDRYRTRYPDKAAMGKLSFDDIDITPLSEDAVMAFGRWKLERQKDTPSGLFTLIFRKTAAGWKIVHDHTSSAKD